MHDAADDALLAAMVAGDGDAAAAFVRRYQRRVFGVAFAVLGDRGRADEVAQEAFVKVWRHGGTFDARRGSVTTWVLALTRNLAIDVLRSQRVRPVEHLEALELRLVSLEIDPAAAALADDDRGRVLVALQAMSIEQRRAVVLTAMGGRTARELGEIDGIPLGTAKTRIRTGLKRLREALAEEAVDS